MAAFCTKCGSTIPDGTGFCPACGAPAGAGNVAAQPAFTPVPVPVAIPVAQPVVQAAPAASGYSQVNTGGAPPAAAYSAPASYPAAQAAPPAKSGGALKIILIIVAVVIGLGIIAAGVVGYGIYRVAHSVAHTVHVDDKGNGTISVLGSSISTGKDLDISESDLGVPLYPGATKGEGGMNMKMPSGTMISAVYLTDDAPSVVEAFYKGKLGENESDIESTNATVMSSSKDLGGGKKNSILITISPNKGDSDNKTQIAIVHTTSNQ